MTLHLNNSMWVFKYSIVKFNFPILQAWKPYHRINCMSIHQFFFHINIGHQYSWENIICFYLVIFGIIVEGLPRYRRQGDYALQLGIGAAPSESVCKSIYFSDY
jgi:hypothetical protein